MARKTVNISLDKMLLDGENPRHSSLKSQKEIIAHLCAYEKVYELAEDICKHGINDLENLALIEDGDMYVVAEGNRRVCALKLLNKPSLLSTKSLRKKFENLSRQKCKKIQKVSSAIFDNRDDPALKIYLQRLHNGEQGGKGRRAWGTEEQERFSHDQKNLLRRKLLDYAVEQGMIEPEKRKFVTIIDRFLANEVLKNTLGIVGLIEGELAINRPVEDFNLRLKAFLEDWLSRNINTRNNKSEIIKYSNGLANNVPISEKNIENQIVTKTKLPDKAHDSSTAENQSGSPGQGVGGHKKGGQETKGKSDKPSNNPSKPKRTKNIQLSRDVQNLLKSGGHKKLAHFYYSICKLPLQDHTLILDVAVWSFFDSMTALMGREKGAFKDYLNKNRLETDLGFAQKQKRNDIHGVLERISINGNLTKHHEVAANFHAEQLANDMEVLTPLIVGCLQQINSNKQERNT